MHHDDEAPTNASNNPYFGDVLQAAVSRRQVLRGGASAAGAALFSSFAFLAPGEAQAGGRGLKLGFDAVAKSLADVVTVPPGYTARALFRTGDPIAAGVAAYLNDGTDADMHLRAGDQHDAIAYFGLGGSGQWAPGNSSRGLLAMNFENILPSYLHPTGATSPRPQAQVDKEIAAHGVGIVEIRKYGGTFEVVQDSPLNRRITAATPMELRGAVAGSALAVTKYDPSGRLTRGTVNNCANGVTPWGTYLTCEENWNGYFRRASTDAANRSATENKSLARYGIGAGAGGANAWASLPGDAYERWNCTKLGASADGSDDYRNVTNTFGWAVEMDPFDPVAAPRKRTALGRMGHEGAWVGPVKPGEPVVFYMGDDARFEYMYKFVSARPYDPARRGLAAGDYYLDEGTLYVARFNEDGTGDWIELAYGSNGLTAGNAVFPFVDQATVLVNTRLAADAVGATKMDRPEWAAVHPRTGEVYLTLTNNTNRGIGSNPGPNASNPRNYDATTGSTTTSLNGNVNGHIIRWREDGDTAGALTFVWDIYLFGSRAAYPADVNVSGLSDDNDFSSPDGLWFDPRGLLWIQTDDGAYTDTTNCMMLAAVPGSVGDGGATTVGSQATIVGAPASGDTLRRFLVGPVDCEITGVCMTPDNRTMFVNIQHPGEGGTFSAPNSHWPDGGASRPRSATIAITRDDGGPIGLEADA
jgi:secreted PhoX family phosphatase